MANVAAGSRRLYVHALAAWAVTGYTLWVLWRYNKEAVRCDREQLAVHW